MDNELIIKRTWWNKNWKWLIPVLGFFMATIIIFISKTDGLSDFAQTYADPTLCQNAIDEANKNPSVIENLGVLESIDKLAILEGNAVYSNDNTIAQITVRVNGTKGKAKMDIVADRVNGKWQYRTITIRIKTLGKTIDVVK